MSIRALAGAGGLVRMYSLGRQALEAALRTAGVTAGDKVLLPAFICREVLASVNAVGATPAYYEVGRSLLPQLPPPQPTVKAVVAVNYFGFAQPMEVFQSYCAVHGACLIEDNAHGFLSRDEHGRLLGTRGDMGIFSFRKTIPAPDGAALVVSQSRPHMAVPDALPARMQAVPLAYRAKRVLSRAQDISGVPFYRWTLRAVRQARAAGVASVPIGDAEHDMGDLRAIHSESERMLHSLDVAAEIGRRRSLFREFASGLRSLGVSPLFTELPPGAVPYGYPFRASPAAGALAGRLAARRGFNCAQWPQLPAAVEPTAPAFYRDVWWVNFLR
jgi:hypothetical protein